MTTNEQTRPTPQAISRVLFEIDIIHLQIIATIQLSLVGLGGFV